MAAPSNCCAIWSRAEPSRVSTPPASPSNSGQTSAASRGLTIQFNEVEKRYGMRLALRGVSLEIAAGECVALVGHNGSGKTTLLKIAAQLSQPSRGKIAFHAEAKSRSPLEEVKSRVGMVGHHTLLYEELTAEENLDFLRKIIRTRGSGRKSPARRSHP